MRISFFIGLGAGVLMGAFGAYWFFTGFSNRGVIMDADVHWNAVYDYWAYLKDQENGKRVEGSPGLVSTPIPFRLEPHLAILEALGELEHENIVLDGVYKTRENTIYWMEYCGKYPDEIVEASLQARSGGEQGPLLFHMDLWYKPSAKALVDQLIEDLKKMGGSKEKGTAREESKDEES